METYYMAKNAVVTAPMYDMLYDLSHTMFCVNCMTLCCTECLAIMHPQSGTFGPHQIITFEQYMSEKAPPEAVVKTSLSNDDTRASVCRDDLGPFRLFCGTCQRWLFSEDLSRHAGHSVLDVITTYTPTRHEESKVSPGRLQDPSRESIQKLIDRKQMTELRAALNRCDIVKLPVPESSGRKSGDGDDVHNPAVHAQSKGASGFNSAKPGETVHSRSAALSGEDTARIVQVPELKFTSSDGRNTVRIEQGGAKVVGTSVNLAWPTYVRTDGRLMAGLLYWEVDVTWDQTVPRGITSRIGSVGVRQEGSHFRYPLGCDKKSWSVDLFYPNPSNPKNVGVTFQHDGKCFGGSRMTYENTPMAIGFLLQAAGRTLAVIDVNKDTMLFTFTDVDLSQPLVPVVGFEVTFAQMAFRLPRVNPSRLP